MLHALVDVYFEEFLVRDSLLSLTHRTPIARVDDLSATATFITRMLHLLEHRPELTQGNPDTATITRCALTDSTLLASLSGALDANDVAVQSEFGELAPVEVFEGDVNTMNEVLRPARALRSSSSSAAAEEPSTTTSTEELAE